MGQISREFVVHGRDEIHVFLRAFDPTSVLFKEELPTVLRLQEITEVRWHLMSGKNLDDLCELDDKGKPAAEFQFDCYRDVVALMPPDAMRNDDLIKGRAAIELSEREQREMKEEVVLDQRIFEGSTPEFQKEVQAR